MSRGLWMAVEGFGPNMENVLKGMGNTFLTQALTQALILPWNYKRILSFPWRQLVHLPQYKKSVTTFYFMKSFFFSFHYTNYHNLLKIKKKKNLSHVAHVSVMFKDEGFSPVYSTVQLYIRNENRSLSYYFLTLESYSAFKAGKKSVCVCVSSFLFLSV